MRKMFLLIVCSMFICFLSSCSKNAVEVDSLPPEGVSGSQSGTDYQRSYTITASNGENVVFQVKNTGNVNVFVTINKNESAGVTLLPSEEGEISVKLSSKATQYDFKVVPTPNGGSISIEYHIFQE